MDELAIILCYLNPFLAKMAEEARMQLCSYVGIEEVGRERVGSLWT